MIDFKDDQPTPRPLRIMNPDAPSPSEDDTPRVLRRTSLIASRHTSTASSTSFNSAMSTGSSSVNSAMIPNEFTSAADSLINIRRVYDRQGGASQGSRFPVDGDDKPFKLHYRNTRTLSTTSQSSTRRVISRAMARIRSSEGTSTRQSTFTDVSTSRLSLLGSRFRRPTTKLKPSQRSSFDDAGIAANSTAGRRVTNCHIKPAHEIITDINSLNPLREPPSTPAKILGDSGQSPRSNTSDCLEYVPTIAVPKIRTYTFSVVGSNSAIGMKGSIWLIVEISCAAHNAAVDRVNTSLDVFAHNPRLVMVSNDRGYLRNLELVLSIPDNCVLLTKIGHLKCSTLDIGNIWTVILRLGVKEDKLKPRLSIPFKMRGKERLTASQAKPTSHLLMDELQTMLKVTTTSWENEVPEYEIKATLSYAHTLFPDDVQIKSQVTCSTKKAIADSRHAARSEATDHGQGSLLNQQNRYIKEKEGLCNIPEIFPHSLDGEEYMKIAEGILGVLRQDVPMEDKFPSCSFPPPRIDAADAVHLLADFDRVAADNLATVISLDLKLMRSVYEKIGEAEKEPAAKVAASASHGHERKSLFTRHRSLINKTQSEEPMPQPPIIVLNAPCTENRRNALDLDRQVEDFGVAFRDLTNRPTQPRHPFQPATLKDRARDVPAPLFSPRKRPRQNGSELGYGLLGMDVGSFTRKVGREFGGMYEAGSDGEKDEAKIIWDKIRRSSEESGMSEEDEERLEGSKLTGSPWM